MKVGRLLEGGAYLRLGAYKSKYGKVGRLLEGGAYLRLDAYKSKYGKAEDAQYN